MARPLLSLMLFFALGDFCALCLPKGWHLGWLLALLVLVLVVFWRLNRQGRLKTPLLLLPTFLIGLFYTMSYLSHQQAGLDAFVDQKINLRGQVVSDPVFKTNGWRFQLAISGVQTKTGWLQADEEAIVKLTVDPTKTEDNSKSNQSSPIKQISKGNRSAQTDQTLKTNQMPQSNRVPQTSHPAQTPQPPQNIQPPLLAGDLVTLSDVQLEKLQPANNPGAFDAASYYGRQGIHYQLALTTNDWRVTGHDSRGLQGRLFAPLRRTLLHVIQQEFPPEQGAVVAGLLLGVTDQLDPAVMSSFRTLGVVHILAVSGANVALMVFPLLRVLHLLPLSHRKRHGIAIFAVLMFGGLTGGGASVVRACVMSMLWLLGKMLSRDSDGLNALAVSAWLALLLNPLSVADLSFQLTYLLTIGLFVLPQRLRPFFHRLPPKMANEIVLTISSELISVPLVLLINSTYTPLSLLANLYIVPVLAFLVPAASIALLLGLIHPALGYLPALCAQGLLHLLIDPLTYVGQAGWLVRNYQAPSVWWLWLYFACLFLFAVQKVKSEQAGARFYNRWRRAALLFGCMALLGSAVWRFYAPRDLQVTFIDVGQGDSELIEMPHGAVWLVDGGGIPGNRPGQMDIGEQIVVPVLAAKGINVIDTVVMTHPDQDHVKGLAAVFKHLQVRQVVVSDLTDPSPFYQDLLKQVREKGIPLHLVQAGEQWTPETGVKVTFFNPPAHKYVGTRSDTNSNSVVFSLKYGQKSFLFMADYEGEVEPNLPIHEHIDVLKVAHHGSGYATYAPFLQKITPTEAILSVGAHNRYGHPAPATVKRLQQSGARIWRTDRQGAIVCTTDGQTMQIYSWLEKNAH